MFFGFATAKLATFGELTKYFLNFFQTILCILSEFPVNLEIISKNNLRWRYVTYFIYAIYVFDGGIAFFYMGEDYGTRGMF